MSGREDYLPGPAAGAEIRKDGDTWTLVLVRELRHPPAVVWEALTDPAQLAAWAPFDANRNLGAAGPVKLTTVGAPRPQVSDCTVKRAEPPTLLEYSWGDGDLRWQLEARGDGTRLTLWHNINRAWIAAGAAGWHICVDVLDRLLAGAPIGRLVGPAAMTFGGWQRLAAEYGRQLGVPLPPWPPKS
ncbi:MAG TPA: SRPBCC domain-containing protein [Polyangia bacterium]|nr:SRPBCC domain-containing protein [Polyangia bacterium]